jgi:prepilin-type N-terminal cleavage/methylation domain-containing protein
MKNKLKSFTLVEVLVTVVIIGILSGLAMVYYTKAIEKGRGAEADQYLGDIRDALISYYYEVGEPNGGVWQFVNDSSLFNTANWSNLYINEPNSSNFDYFLGCGPAAPPEAIAYANRIGSPSPYYKYIYENGQIVKHDN